MRSDEGRLNPFGKQIVQVEVSEPGMRKNFIRSIVVTQSILSVFLKQLYDNVLQLRRISDFWVTQEGHVLI